MLFSVNPSGVQIDGAWSETAEHKPRFSYDAVWNSDGHVTSTGWPHSSTCPSAYIRFNPANPNWGFVLFRRTFPATLEQAFSPRVAADISGILSQEATLTDIDGSPARTMSSSIPTFSDRMKRLSRPLIPIIPTSAIAALKPLLAVNSKQYSKTTLLSTRPSIQISATSNLTSLNSLSISAILISPSYALLLRDANNFTTPINLIYTRNIVDPEMGFASQEKSTTVTSAFSLLTIVSQSKTMILATRSTETTGRVTVGRFSQDLRQSLKSWVRLYRL